MYKAVFFDLDGTLLPMDLNQLLDEYFRRLTVKMAPMVEPETFTKALMEGTKAMLYNDGSRTNEQAFMQTFFPLVDKDAQQLMPVFDEFYRQDYPTLDQNVKPIAQAREAVELAKSREVDVVLATNPVFPRVAVDSRLQWAGLEDFPFRHVTSYENSSYCKPNPNYYREILDEIGLRGEDCLMVGNDAKEDLSASELGFDTFLLEGYLIERQTGYSPTWQGGWDELLQVLGQ